MQALAIHVFKWEWWYAVRTKNTFVTLLTFITLQIKVMFILLKIDVNFSLTNERKRYNCWMNAQKIRAQEVFFVQYFRYFVQMFGSNDSRESYSLT